jgi:hypothetical protein
MADSCVTQHNIPTPLPKRFPRGWNNLLVKNSLSAPYPLRLATHNLLCVAISPDDGYSPTTKRALRVIPH